jgi:hypothetical protein
MKKILIAKQTDKNKWKVLRRYTLEKKDLPAIAIVVLTIGYVTIRCLVG